MKNIEAQVTDLETSKALQEAGIKYETAFVWAGMMNANEIIEYTLIFENALKECKFSKPAYCEIIPAFTAGELMQVLPAIIDYKAKPFLISCGKNDADFYWSMYANKKDILKYIFENELSKALAKLCLWCKENKYV